MFWKPGFFFFFSLSLLGLHPWHMKSPRLGVKSKLKLPAYTRATPPDLSHVCNLHHSHSKAGSLTHWARLGIKPASSWILVGFVTNEPQRELCFFFCFFFGAIYTCGIWKFPGQGSNWSCGWWSAPQLRQPKSWAASVTYTIACSNTGSLNHWVRPRIKPAFSWILAGFLTCWTTTGTPPLPFLRVSHTWPHQHLLLWMVTSGPFSCIKFMPKVFLYPCPLFLFSFFLSFFLFFFNLLRASPTAYGGSQARRLIRAVAPGLRQSHSNTRSLTHCVRLGIEPTTSWFLVRFASAAPWRALLSMSLSFSYLT